MSNKKNNRQPQTVDTTGNASLDETADIFNAGVAKAAEVTTPKVAKKATRVRTASPLPTTRLLPKDRVSATNYYAKRLNNAGVAVEAADSNLQLLAVQAREEKFDNIEALVLRHFAESASQRGWDHFVRDTKLAMAAKENAVQGPQEEAKAA